MSAERELLLQELNNKTKHLEKLEKLFKEVEMKSKTDLKILIKEVKFLRKSQESIREELNHLIREKDEIEVQFSGSLIRLCGLFLLAYVGNILNISVGKLPFFYINCACL